MEGFTATAFVRMLRRKRDAIHSELNAARNDQQVKEFLVRHLITALAQADDLLAEAVKLQNAIINKKEWSIRPDGTVRVDVDTVDKPLPPQQGMAGL